MCKQQNCCCEMQFLKGNTSVVNFDRNMESYVSATSSGVETSMACSDSIKQAQSTFNEKNSSPNCVVDSGYHSLSNVVCSDEISDSNATISTSNDTIAMQTIEHGTKNCKSIPPVRNTMPVTCHSYEHVSQETCNGSSMGSTENQQHYCGSMNNAYSNSVNNDIRLVCQHKEPQNHSSLIKLPPSSVHTYDSCYTSASTKSLYTKGQDNSYQEHQHAFTKAASSYEVMKPRVISGNQLNTDLKADWQDLAIKIEFCLMFGYTPAQIRAAISKLSWKASKNDILAELSALQSAPVLHNSSGIPLSHSDYNDTYGNHCYEGDNSLVIKGIDSLADNDLQARGPLPFENGHKEEETIPEDDYKNLRPIVIDGSNVAMSHGNKQYFSCKGILLAVDFFRKRNHSDITVFVPTYRKESRRPDAPIRDREILTKLEEDHILVYTPSRCIDGKRVTCYDDRFILKLAQDTDGIIVSNDNFRDLKSEKPEWKELIEKRVLMYSFVSDRFMPPDDPLGRNGPIIDNFLRKRPASEEQKKPQCPYGKKCTYGKKCKYFHPESSRSITDSLKEQSNKRMKASNLAEQLASELMTHDTPPLSNARQKTTVQSAKLTTQNSPQPANGYREHAEQNDDKSSSPRGIKMDNSRLLKARVDNLPPPEQSCCRHLRQCDGSGSIENMQSIQFHGQANRNLPYAQCSHEAVNPTTYPQYQASPNHLSESLTQKLSISGPMHSQHSHLVSSRHPVPNRHQVCYDTQGQAYPVMNDPSRVHNSYSTSKVSSQQVMYSEVGTADFHQDNHSSVKNPMLNQRNVQHYQHSSHGNMQVFDGRSGEAVLQPQHLNTATPYQRVPALHSSYSMSARPAYHASYNDAQYQSVPQQLVYSYPVSNNTHSAPRMHQSMVQTPYYAPSLSPSTGSDNSLSLSYHILPDGQISTSLHSSLSSSNNSKPNTYPPPSITRRINSSPGHQVPLNIQQRFHSPSLPNAHYSPNGSLPLNSPEHPKHHLYQNLCSLLDPNVVTKVMSSNPNLSEPKEVIKLCLRESD